MVMGQWDNTDKMSGHHGDRSEWE